MSVYYNEIEPYCVAWLKNLMAEGLIAKGDVDDRPIQEVRGADVRGYTQYHWFAGLGGWAYAFRLAEFPEDRKAWSGSCPCQPGSVAGKQEGFDDPRHLWPFWKPLIAECKPPTVFGEQVAGWSDWLRLVRSDLEEMGYAVGAIPIEAASAGADHFRDRYWFVGHASRRQQHDRQPHSWGGSTQQSRGSGSRGSVSNRNVANSTMPGKRGRRLQRPSTGTGTDAEWSPGKLIGCSDSLMANRDGERAQESIRQPGNLEQECAASARSAVRGMVNDPSFGWGEGWTESEFRRWGFTAAVASIDGCQYVECPDGKWRRLPPPRVRWLGNGLQSRISKLRAIGNAIDPRPATAFIRAFMESETCPKSTLST